MLEIQTYFAQTKVYTTPIESELQEIMYHHPANKKKVG